MFTRSIDALHAVRSCVPASPSRTARAIGAAGLLVVGCAGSATTNGFDGGSRAVRGAPVTVFVSSQLGIAGSGASVFDALVLLRPSLVQWSYIPGASFEEHIPTVFLDGVRLYEPDALNRIPCSRVRKIVVLDRAEARSRYGPGVVGGAILITSVMP